MLAELGEQKSFLSHLPELRRTFERFLAGGTSKGDWPFRHKNTYVWRRGEVLHSNGNSFMLNVSTDSFYQSLSEANLVITVSSADGSEVREVLPSIETLLKTRTASDYVELPERLAELKNVVDNFLGPKKPNIYSTG